MFGAIIGDLAGSRYEFNNIKRKHGYQLLERGCCFTDDTAMTLAVSEALLHEPYDSALLPGRVIASMQRVGRKYHDAGFGGRFRAWLEADQPVPYQSWGNGAAMRISPCAYISEELQVCLSTADAVTNVTHDHPESIRAARAVVTAIFMARHGSSRDDIRRAINEQYYAIDFTLDEIRPFYRFDVSCQGSVPQALEAFFESVDFEDAIRNAISIGGDSDTIACITGGIAGAYYGVPAALRRQALSLLPDDFRETLVCFEARFMGS